MIKILILDDEKGTCGHIGKFFKHRGHKIFTTSSGEEALSIIKKERPQILLLDIKMQGINGLEVLRQAKKDNPSVKAIMITGLDDPATKEQAKALGADKYITKPFSFEILESLIIHKVNEVLKLEEGQNK